MIAKYASLKVWNRTDRSNIQLYHKRKGDIRYVLLIPKTECFNMREDIVKTLDVREKPYFFVSERFSSLGVVVEYFTLFSQRDKSTLGPVSTDIPEKICLLKYKELYFPFKKTIAFVGSKYIAKNFPEDVRFITVEQFVVEILFPTK